MTYNYLTQQSHYDKNNIQVGATNLLIILELREGLSPLDISSATIKNILIEKPDNSIITASGSFTTNGTDGLLYYKTMAGDLNLDGTYNVQAYLAMPDFTGYSTPISFKVYPNLPLDNN